MMKTSIALLFVMGLVLSSSQVGVTQSQADLEAIRKELDALKKNQQNLQREVETLKKSLGGRRRAPNAFKPMVLNVGNDPYKGDLNARLTIVDFSDYQ